MNVCVSECAWCVCVCVWMCVGLALHCKSKSSDDIIITVSETDGRSCVSACVSIRQEISHYTNCSDLIKPQADTLIQRALRFLTFSLPHEMLLPWSHRVKKQKNVK
jgi:hypothetical protein